MLAAAHGKKRQYDVAAVYVDESLASIPIGAPVALDADNADADKRSFYVKRPTLGRLHDTYGVIVDDGRGSKPTPGERNVLTVGGEIKRGVQVLTDENIVAGDLLAPIPGTNFWGKAVASRPLFRATEAINGSVDHTLGRLVRGDLGLHIDPERDGASKLMRLFDHFDGRSTLNITGFTPAEISTAGWTLSGTSATAAHGTADALGLTAGGAIALTGNTTNLVMFRNSGFQIVLGTGRSVFFRTRFKIDAITQDWFAGLAITGNIITDTTSPTALDDYIGFWADGDASPPRTFLYHTRDNATDRGHASGVAVVADTFMEVAFLLRVKAAGDALGSTHIAAWLNGTQFVDSQLAADAALISKDEAMGVVFGAIGSAPVMTIDYVECCYYFG